jgi:Na+-transporting NADH:ubiquinone oxidoreductase subunit NqrF
MKKINLRGISEILSENEMKKVVGGVACLTDDDCTSGMCMSGSCGGGNDCRYNEFLYHCSVVITWEDGDYYETENGGAVCAQDRHQAELYARSTIWGQINQGAGIYDIWGHVDVRCISG